MHSHFNSSNDLSAPKKIEVTHCISCTGYTEAAIWLLKNGADASIPDVNGTSAFEQAVIRNQVQVADFTIFTPICSNNETTRYLNILFHRL